MSRLTECLGIEGALSLVAFYDGVPTMYVPECYRAGHLLERVVGEDGFLALIANFGGETVGIPRAHFDPERRIGAVYRALRGGLTTSQIAGKLGISPRRVRQIAVEIEAGRPLTIAARRA
jgi:hypothetical protein